MRKYICKILIVITCIGLFIGFKTNVEAVTVNKVNVKMQLGFNNQYKVGFYAPVTLNIDNNYKDIKGEIEIRVPSSSGKYISYVKGLNIQKGTEKEVKIYIPISGNRLDYPVLINNGKEKIYEDVLSVNNISNTATAFIGILSEDKSSLGYINTVPQASGMTVMTNPIFLNENTFPEDFLALKSFDVIVINNFDTTKLSKNAYELLKQWVKDGGTLLIGTGGNANKTLGAFKDDFIKGNIGDKSIIKTSKINTVGSNGDNNNEVDIEVSNLSIDNSTTVLEDKGVKLLQTLKAGKGAIGIVAFDLGQSPLIQWSNNSAFSQKLLAMINKDLSNNFMKNQGNPYQEFNIIKNISDGFSEIRTANTSNFYIILFIYIIVVAPLSYLVLKRLDKREFMWITVPVLAIFFGGIVFFSASNGRLNKYTTNVISEVYLDQSGNAGCVSYASILAPSKANFTLESKSGTRLSNVANPNGNMQAAAKSDLEAKVYSEGNAKIEYYNTSIIQNQVVQIQQHNLELGKIETNIKPDGINLTGSVKNTTKLDLDDCYIITTDGYYPLGDIKRGQSVNIPKFISVGLGDTYSFANRVIMGNVNQNYINPRTMSQNNRNKYMYNSQKSELLALVYGNYGGNNFNGTNFIGFSKTPIQEPLLVNGKQETVKYERSVVKMPIEKVEVK